MRHFTINFSSKYPVQGSMVLGCMGEHNATELSIIPPDIMKNNNEISYYKVVFGFECDQPYSSPALYKDIIGDVITIDIPYNVTSHSIVSVQLEGYDDNENLVIKSSTIHGLVFEPSVFEEKPNYNTDMSTNQTQAPENMQGGIFVVSTDSDGYAESVIIYGDLPSGVLMRNGYSRIKKVTMVGSTIVPSNLFRDCSLLEEVKLPNSVVEIGDGAFQGCSKLQSINLPSGLVCIEPYAFYGCRNLQELLVPDTVLEIGEHAFGWCSSLTSFIFPNDVTTIEQGLFYYCGSLSKVTVSAKTNIIKNDAFNNCASLTSIFLPDTLTEIQARAFYSCRSLLSIIIPNSVMQIGSYAFSGCSSLETVVLSSNIHTIDSYTFRYCRSLKNIILPNSVTSINDYAFADCDSLEEIVMPVGLGLIGRNAFSNCISLVTADLRCGIEHTNTSTFSGCKSLKNVYLPNTLKSISPQAFSGCISLEYISIPESVTSIGNRAFFLSGLTNISLPSVSYIGYDAFRQCVSLKEVSFATSGTLVEIDMHAFDGCAISTINNFESIYIIEECAFAGNDFVTITFGSNISKIGGDCFTACSRLSCIYIKSPTPPSIGFRPFPIFNDLFIGVFVPATDDDSVLDSYKSATNWSDAELVDKIFEWDEQYISSIENAEALSVDEIDQIISEL